MRRPSSPRLTVSALAATLALGGGCGGSTETGSTVEYQAEDLLTGQPTNLADLRGSVVLLAGWTTWCAPCRAELPELNELHEAQQADGLVVVAVNLDPAGPSVREVLPLVGDMGLTMPTWIDTDNSFALAFDATFMPTNVLVDREGVVRHTWAGAIDPDDNEIADAIDELLDQR